ATSTVKASSEPCAAPARSSARRVASTGETARRETWRASSRAVMEERSSELSPDMRPCLKHDRTPQDRAPRSQIQAREESRSPAGGAGTFARSCPPTRSGHFSRQAPPPQIGGSNSNRRFEVWWLDAEAVLRVQKGRKSLEDTVQSTATTSARADS